jgi:hypothetical protein
MVTALTKIASVAQQANLLTQRKEHTIANLVLPWLFLQPKELHRVHHVWHRVVPGKNKQRPVHRLPIACVKAVL